ncbi:LuxR C-terminal-related transcriptional regulator [Streptomyces sulphureus]|uniref:LuxR C-terminal-related transcriptional regulator n=1 Tax=Streptomyces sulphureus TaxID=47758 RepID=UPI000371155A|nr:response regulator transcription factor [Streptomyces sulphureus]
MRWTDRYEALKRPHARSAAGDLSVGLVLADEQPLVRRGLRALFESDAAFQVKGEADNGSSLLEAARVHRPDVVVMDARLPGPDILEVVRRLVEDAPEPVAVVLLAAEGGLDDNWVPAAARVGARGFLFKHGSSEKIVSGVRDVAEGGAAMSPGIVGQVLKVLRDTTHRAAAPRPCAELSQLTRREMQVFQMVAQGLTNQQIADVLVLSEATVKSHFNRICRKLALRNRVDAVILAYERGVAGGMAEHAPTA